MTAPGLHRLNTAAPSDAAQALRTCLDVPRWVDEVLAARPFADREAALTAARTAANPLTAGEVEQALAAHPRIGERRPGHDTQARLSASEQSGVDASDAAVARRLQDANAAYERRFGRVFLIRAAGRDAQEILAELERRRGNDDEAELAEVAAQLREIAVLRLEGLIDR